MPIKVIPVRENFLGMSYGDWAAEWDNWLMSEDPERNLRNDIIFLRGNLDYNPVASADRFPRYMAPKSELTLVGKNGLLLFSNSGILIPVLTARYSLGDLYDGRRIDDPLGLRDAVNRDTDESLNVYAVIMDRGNKGKYIPIVEDINDYRIESPMYKLVIGPRARLKDSGEIPSDPGTYDSIIGGFFLIVRCMPRGRYRLKFGGDGRGKYGTHSTYDITVLSKRRRMTNDASNEVASKGSLRTARG